MKCLAILCAIAAMLSAPIPAWAQKIITPHPIVVAPPLPALPAPMLTTPRPGFSVAPAPALQPMRPVVPIAPAPVIVAPPPPLAAEPAADAGGDMSPCDCYIIENTPVISGDRVVYQTTRRWTGRSPQCCPNR